MDVVSQYRHISIHAPAKGAPELIRPAAGDYFISIHAPAKGATDGEGEDELLNIISIHAPAKGALCSAPYSVKTFFYFNPRSREGSDTTAIRGTLILYYFNPRSREGSAKGSDCRSMWWYYFNPRSREGSDPKITYFFSNIDFYLGNTNKLQYCSFHFTILLIIFLLLSMVRTPLPFYVRLPPAPAYIIRIPSAS